MPLKPAMPMLATLLLAAVGACASVGASPPSQAFKTVGVISAFGDELTFTRAGLTALDSAPKSVSIEPWGLDDLVAERTRALLSKRFQVQPVTYRRTAFAARDRRSPLTVVNLLRDDPVKDLVRTEVAPQGLDAYVVITKSTSAYGNRGRTVAGVGIISNDAVLGSYAQLHALYMIRVIDGHDYRMIVKRSAPPPDSAETARLEGPSRRLDASLVPATADLAHDDQLKAAVSDLIEHSLEATLQDVGLVDRS